jgi:hypothetical protein
MEPSAASCPSVSGLLFRGPWLEREEPKGKKVQAWNEREQAPNWIMTGATKDLGNRDNHKKEKNEQHDRGVNEEKRSKVPLCRRLYRQEM